jgi:hypothetical protein
MELFLVVVSLFVSVFSLVAIGKLFSIERSLHRLVMLELCDKGVLRKEYCEEYKKQVAHATVVPIEGYRKNHGRDAIVGPIASGH